MNFFDTSVLVSALHRTDRRHYDSAKVLERANKREAACGAHSIAELFSVLSGRPHPQRVPLEAALRLVEQVRKRMEIVTLTEDDYFFTVRESVHAGRMDGIIYDALLLACARKVSADRIYTWNVSHFRAIAPDLAARIVEP